MPTTQETQFNASELRTRTEGTPVKSVKCSVKYIEFPSVKSGEPSTADHTPVTSGKADSTDVTPSSVGATFRIKNYKRRAHNKCRSRRDSIEGIPETFSPKKLIDSGDENPHDKSDTQKREKETSDANVAPSVTFKTQRSFENSAAMQSLANSISSQDF